MEYPVSYIRHPCEDESTALYKEHTLTIIT